MCGTYGSPENLKNGKAEMEPKKVLDKSIILYYFNVRLINR